MKRILLSVMALLCCIFMMAQGPQVNVQGGMIEGLDSSGVKIFLGVPYAAPPVGNLRWKAPQPVKPWQGIRQAKEFGPNPIQKNAFGDMVFGTDKFSEDCLYLNVWTPSKKYNEGLPVLIYFNGGGLLSGAGSEPRYQGLTLARKGIIVVTANYREGIFGFFACKQLSKENKTENGYEGSGNQGFMDQAAAIRWVHDNIAAFGGSPDKITICGESAGSMSVSAQMASKMARGLFSQVMASSGSVVGSRPVATLQQAEKAGNEFMKKAGCKNLEELRAMSAEELNKLYKPTGVPMYCVDGKFFTENPLQTYLKGEQAQVPALIGNNNAELPVVALLGGKAPTIENLKPLIATVYKGADPEEILNLYGIKTDADILGMPGYTLGGDIFIAYSTWKWTDLLRKTSTKPVYRYIYCHPRPQTTLTDKVPGLAGGVAKKESNQPVLVSPGAVHSADIEYAMGNLATNHMFKWDEKDFQVSEIFQKFYLNFVKTGNPNGLGMPIWNPTNGEAFVPMMRIDLKSEEIVDMNAENRYNFIDKYLLK